jgi:hypothetical protein
MKSYTLRTDTFTLNFNLHQVVDAGDRVFVKVVELKEQPGRSTQISLSMKAVPPGTSTAGGGEGEAKALCVLCQFVKIQCV